jgi:hypothetical protein
MEKKTIKFRDNLINPILIGEKNVTCRLFDDKNLSAGDEINLVNWNTGEKFGEAIITDVWEKKMGEIEEKDFDGHEKFSSKEEMFNTFRQYYGDRININTMVKIIRFELKNK